MEERILEIDVRTLFPELLPEDDPCWERVEQGLREQQGVTEVQWAKDGASRRMFVRVDPRAMKVEEARRLVQQVGRMVWRRYGHAQIPIEGMDCSDCAVVVQHGLERMDGVLAARVDFA